MAGPRPTLILHASIDNREYSEKLAAAIKRTYTYISPIVVEEHPAAGEDVENVLRFDVRMMRSYWDENDEKAAAQWDNVMEKWLSNMFYKVSSTITGVNRMSGTHNARPLYYAWTEVQFGDNVVFAFKTNEDCSLDEGYLGIIKQGRHLMCSGALGADIATIRIPSRASYEAQKRVVVEEQRRAAAQEQAAQALEGQENNGVAGASDEGSPTELMSGENQDEQNAADQGASAVAVTIPAVAGVTEPAQEADAAEGGSNNLPSSEEATEAQEGAEEPVEPEEPELPHVNFTPDTTIWGVEYADGSVREYDSSAGAFV